MLSTGEVEPAAIVAKLRQALTAVNDLSSERAALEEALKVEKNRDNILPRIMASSGNYDALFREEIRKYDKLKVLELPRFDQWVSRLQQAFSRSHRARSVLSPCKQRVWWPRPSWLAARNLHIFTLLSCRLMWRRTCRSRRS